MSVNTFNYQILTIGPPMVKLPDGWMW